LKDANQEVFSIFNITLNRVLKMKHLQRCKKGYLLY